MIRMFTKLARLTGKLVIGTVLGALGLVLTGLAPFIAIGAALFLIARAVGS